MTLIRLKKGFVEKHQRERLSPSHGRTEVDTSTENIEDPKRGYVDFLED